MDENDTTMHYKRCEGCDKVKGIDQYNRSPSTQDGLSQLCHACIDTFVTGRPFRLDVLPLAKIQLRKRD